MASSTSSAITAQPEAEDMSSRMAMQSGGDSTVETAVSDTGARTKLPNGRGIARRTSYDPLLNPNDDGDDHGDRDDDDDDRPAPFPPYREPDDEEVDVALDSHGHDPFKPEATPPLPAEDSNSQTSPDAGEPRPEPNAEMMSEPASETPEPLSLSTEPASAADELASPSPSPSPSPQEAVDVAPSTLTTVTSPAALPPPYWTHSRDGSHGHNSRNDNASLDAGRPATAAAAPSKPSAAASFFGAPFLRRLDSSSRSQGTAASSSTARPSTSAAHSSSLHGGNNRNHRRDTSTSTLDLNVNIITLQDNEASDDDDYGDGYGDSNGASRNNGWQYNGAPALSRDRPASPAVSSPTALCPGPPPGSAGSNSGSTATTATTLAATRTTSNTSKANRCWARRVDITDHVVIGAGGNSGSSGGSGLFNTSHSAVHPRLGAFVVWTIRVQTLESTGRPSPSPRAPLSPSAPDAPSSLSAPAPGHSFCIYKRYSEFDTLRRRLVASFPQARGGGALPPLPPKSVLGKFRPEFLEKRRLGLQYFLNCILLNPEFAGSPVLQDFLFS